MSGNGLNKKRVLFVPVCYRFIRIDLYTIQIYTSIIIIIYICMYRYGIYFLNIHIMEYIHKPLSIVGHLKTCGEGVRGPKSSASQLLHMIVTFQQFQCVQGW